MNQPARRVLAATTAGIALAATLASTPSATAEQAQPSASKAGGAFAKYGFKGTASGARLFVNNVEVLSLNEAMAPLRCTRKTDYGNEVASTLTAPEGSPIQLSASTNSTKSYREGDRVGVRATSILGDIQLGDATGETTGGVPTPTISIEGLTTVADAFHDKGSGFGHEESITDLDLQIDLLPGQEADDQLQELLDAIDTELLAPVLQVLQDAAAPIEIPGLGSIALGRMKGSTTDHSADSDASALEIVINATGETQRLVLGDVHSRIGGPVKASVFRSTSMPMSVDVAEGFVRLGHVRPRTIPCEGTGGREVVKKLASASVVLPEGLLAGVKGIEYRSMGDQRADGSARGYEVSSIGEFSIPALDLVVEGISSRVGARTSDPGGKVAQTSKVKVLKILYQGEEIAVPEPGKSRLVDGLGIVETGVVTEGNRFGKRVTALRLTLTDYGPTVIDLGIAASRVYHY